MEDGKSESRDRNCLLLPKSAILQHPRSESVQQGDSRAYQQSDEQGRKPNGQEEYKTTSFGPKIENTNRATRSIIVYPMNFTGQMIEQSASKSEVEKSSFLGEEFCTNVAASTKEINTAINPCHNSLALEFKQRVGTGGGGSHVFNKFSGKPKSDQDDNKTRSTISKEHTTMAPTLKLISSINGSRPLRQINIVGQLNHSARRGLLMVMFESALSLIALLCLLSSSICSRPASLVVDARWPFGSGSLLSRANTSLTASSDSPSHQSVGASLWQTLAQGAQKVAAVSPAATLMTDIGSKRNPRNPSLAESAAAGQSTQSRHTRHTAGASPLPMTEQYHYFWNHDQIDQKTMIDEAQRVLSEAQAQTDKMVFDPSAFNASSRLMAPSSSQDVSQPVSSNGQEPMSTGASSAVASTLPAPQQQQEPMVVIPQAIQQQLTGMVLQLQRQQQLAMMMQPRFTALQNLSPMSNNMVEAQRRLASSGQSPVAHGGLKWPSAAPFSMAANSQQPIVAVPPPLGHSNGHLMMAQESLVNAQQHSMQPQASVAGVPVYGPFMVAPSVARAPTMLAHQPMSFMAGTAQMQHLNQATMAAQAAAAASRNSQHSSALSGKLSLPASSRSSFASSLLRGRKSWPFNAFSSSSNSNNNNNREQFQTAGSQPRATFVSAPAVGQISDPNIGETARALANALPPESLALIDMTSNQLANAIVSQMSMRSAQQRLMAAIVAAAASAAATGLAPVNVAATTQPQDPLEAAGSSLTGQSAANARQPDTVEQFFNLVSSAPAMSQAKPNLQPPYLLNSALPAVDLGNPILAGNISTQSFWSTNQQPASMNQFGIRLKRRQLIASPPTSVLLDNHSSTSTQRVGDSKKVDSINESKETMFKSKQILGFDLAATRMSKKSSPSSSSASSWPALAAIHVDAQSSGNIFDQPPSTTDDKDSGKTKVEEPETLSGSSLRRLKRSLPEVRQANRTSRALKSSRPTSSSFSSGWKSMDSGVDETSESWSLKTKSTGSSTPASTTTSPAGSTLASSPSLAYPAPATKPIKTPTSSNSGWTASSRSRSGKSDDSSEQWHSIGSTSAAPILRRRQAELVAAVGPNPVVSTKETSNTISQPNNLLVASSQQASVAGLGVQPQRQDRSLKIKRITAGASVLHHAHKHSAGDSFSSSSYIDTAKRQALARANIAQRPSLISLSDHKEPQQQQQRASSSGSENSQQRPASEASVSQSSQQQELNSQQVDPMAASLSESARVVNYFANVDNEQPSSSSSSPSSSPSSSYATSTSTTTTTTARPSPGNSQPNMNVGFPAPTKIMQSHQQSLSSPQNNMASQQQQQPSVVVGRLNRTNQMARTGNGQLSYSSAAGVDYSAGRAGGLGDLSGQQQAQYKTLSQLQQQQQQQLQQSPALANNADISSAATGHQAYAIQNGATGSGAGVSMAAPQQQHLPSMMRTSLPYNHQPTGGQKRQLQLQSAASNRFSGQTVSPLASLQGTNLLNALFGLDPSTKRSSSPATTIMAAGPEQQPIYQPQAKENQQMRFHNNQNIDRAPSADQSNTFNEEVLPPGYANQQQQQSPSPMHGSSANNDQQMFNQDSAAQQANGLPPGFSDNSFGARNQQQQNQESAAQFASDQSNQMMELNRFNQQQQQQQQQQEQQASQLAQQQLFGSSSLGSFANSSLGQDQPQQFVPPPSVADTSSVLDSMYSSGPSQTQQITPTNQQFMQQQLQQQLQQQPQATSSLNWQKIQSLGNAVSTFNSQVQQFEDLQRQSAQQLQQQALMPSGNNFDTNGQHQSFNGQVFGQQQRQQLLSSSSLNAGLPIDEEAAANAAAAAGIPTYPNAAQLMALQAIQQQQQQFNQSPSQLDLSSAASLLMAGSEQRSESEDGSVVSSNKKRNGGKKGKTNGTKHISHHYHFNGLTSPLEDPDGQFAQLDFAGSLAAQEQARANKAALAKQRAKKEEEEQRQQNEAEENEKPKKKNGFLRRFSLKNLFKRFKKDKKKENAEQDQEQEQAEPGAGHSSNENGGGSSSYAD